MRIISPFHDYYDIGLKYGIDPKCIYVRQSEEYYIGESQEGDDIHKRLSRYKRALRVNSLRVNSLNEVTPHYIAFCGKIYLCLYVRYWGPGVSRGYSTYVYNYSELIKFAKKLPDKKPLKELEAAGNKKGKRGPHKHRASIKKIFEEFPSKQDDNVVQLLIDYKVPIMMLYDEAYYPKVELNPCLKTVEFFKAVDPVTAFQELSMFVSGVMGGQVPPMVAVSDNVRLEKHGFDKITSFRKMLLECTEVANAYRRNSVVECNTDNVVARGSNPLVGNYKEFICQIITILIFGAKNVANTLLLFIRALQYRKPPTAFVKNAKRKKLFYRRCRMPRRDGTGPQGKGPRTGRGKGKCKPKK